MGKKINNPVLEAAIDCFIEEANGVIAEYHKQHLSNVPAEPIKTAGGSKYLKLTRNRSVWGFIALCDGKIGKYEVSEGDLLKAASYNAPAPGYRGNILMNNCAYGPYGPSYLN